MEFCGLRALFKMAGWLRHRNKNDPVLWPQSTSKQGQSLKQVVRGYFHYHAVLPGLLAMACMEGDEPMDHSQSSIVNKSPFHPSAFRSIYQIRNRKKISTTLLLCRLKASFPARLRRFYPSFQPFAGGRSNRR